MNLLVCALESSSNVHLKELKKYLSSDTVFLGVFDKQLGTPLYDLSHLAIMGFVDVIKKLSFFFKLRDELVELAASCDKVLLLDSSGFNLPLAKKIKEKYPNKEIIYYILPQVWVWKRKRVLKLEKYCTHLCSIIPFEHTFYNDQNKIKYVGHPLVDEIKEYKTTISTSNIIVYMPGSRKSEIKNHMPIFRQLVKKIQNQQNIIVIPKNFSQEYISLTYGDLSDFIISNDTHSSLLKAKFAFICSGTATLESALIGTPFVLSYIAKKIDYMIAKTFLKVPFVGLANIFFHKMNKQAIHKEYIQDEVNVDNLYGEYEAFNRKDFFKNAEILRKYLQTGSSQNVAKIIEK